MIQAARSAIVCTPDVAWSSMPNDEVLNTKALVQRFGMSASFWNKGRVSGDSPPFLKCGRRVLYRVSDVEVWLDSKRRTSTSDPGPRKQ